MNNEMTIQKNDVAENLEVIKGLVAAQGLSDSEFKQFVVQCKRTGLDPVTRQIYAMKQGNRLAVMTSIDGFRVIAQRSGDYAGQDGPYWCGDDGKWVDVWLSKTPPSAAKVGVLKRGFSAPLYAVAVFSEYSKNTSPTWKNMPALMIAKVAEALALRKAFPNDMSGVYTDDEMDQAEHSAPAKQVSSIVINQPTATTQRAQVIAKKAADVMDAPHAEPVASAAVVQEQEWEPHTESGSAPTEYVVTFGKKHKGKTLQEIGAQEVESYLRYILGQAQKDNKEITGQVLDFVNAANDFLASQNGGV